MKVFDILSEFRALDNLMNEINLVTGEYVNSENDIKEYIEKLNLDKATKLNNIQDLKLEYKANIDALKNKIDTLVAKKKSFEAQIEKLVYLQELLLNGEKLKTDEFTFFFRTSKSVKVPDEVNPTHPRVKIKYEWDKKEIQKDIENGVDYSEYGISIEEKQSLSVR